VRYHDDAIIPNQAAGCQLPLIAVKRLMRTLKRLKAPLETPLRPTCMAITAAPVAHVCGPGMAWVCGVLLVAVG
jgi:hypothetical protein